MKLLRWMNRRPGQSFCNAINGYDNPSEEGKQKGGGICKVKWAMAGGSKTGLASVGLRMEEEDDKGILAIGTMGVGLAGIESKLLAQIDSLECDKEVTLEDVHELQAELQKVLYISDQITKFKTSHISNTHVTLSNPPPFIPTNYYNEPLEKGKEKENDEEEEDEAAKEGLFPLQEFLENPLNPSPPSSLVISTGAKKVTSPGTAKSKLGLCFCSQPATIDLDDSVGLSQSVTRKSLPTPMPPRSKTQKSSTKWWVNIFRKKVDSSNAIASSGDNERKTKEKKTQQLFCSRSSSIASSSSSSATSTTLTRRNSDSSSISTTSSVLQSLTVDESIELGINYKKYKNMGGLQGRQSTNPESEYWIKTDDDYVVLEL